DMLSGIPFRIDNVPQADKEMRDWERQFTTRAATVAVLDENCKKYTTWLDSLTPDQLAKTVEAPFGLGQIPIGMGINFPPMHTMAHSPQLKYLKTNYANHDWHMGN